MILICPTCDTQYFADDATIGESGRTVKCAACGDSWFVQGDGVVAAAPVDTAEAEKNAERGAHEAYREQVRVRREKKNRLAAMTSWLVTAVIFFSLGVGAVIMRNDVVKRWPESAEAYKILGLEVNRFGLEFAGIDASRTFDGTTPVLSVSGTIENTSRTAEDTPRVRVGLRDEYQREVAHMLAEIEPGRIPAGGIGYFTARLEDPPVESFDLEISFVELGGARSVAENAGRIEAVEPASETPVDGDASGSPSDAADQPTENDTQP